MGKSECDWEVGSDISLCVAWCGVALLCSAWSGISLLSVAWVHWLLLLLAGTSITTLVLVRSRDCLGRTIFRR